MRTFPTALLLLVVTSTGALGALSFQGVTEPYGFVTGLDFHGGLGVASCQTGYVLRTTNGGSSWQKVTLPTALRVVMRDVDVINSNHVVIVGSGHIGYSDDGGATWNDAGGAYFLTPATQRGELNAVSFDGQFGMAVGVDRTGAPLVLRSVDYGHQWQRFPPPAAADLPATGLWGPADVVYRQSERSFVCGAGGRLFVPDAGTGTWQKSLLSSPDTTTPDLYSLFLSSSDKLYVSTSDGYILHDATMSDWTAPSTIKINVPSRPGMGAASLWVDEDATGKPTTLAARLGDVPVVSTDGGSSWEAGVLTPGTGGLWCLTARVSPARLTTPLARSSLDVWVGGLGMGPTPAGLWRASISRLMLLPRRPPEPKLPGGLRRVE